MSHDIEHIIDNPETYGFTWEFAPLHRGVKKDVLVCANAPRMHHVAVDPIRATFGDTYVLESCNGTSQRVRNQTLRNKIVADPTLGHDVRRMQRMIISAALGAKVSRMARTVIVTNTVEKIVFGTSDGTTFATFAESAEYERLLQNANAMIDAGNTDETDDE